jgi:hypothetical protein
MCSAKKLFVVLFFLFFPSCVFADSWLYPWGFRVPVDVFSGSSFDLYGYPVRVVGNFSSEYSDGFIRSDCGDMRFSFFNSSSGEEFSVPFWVELCDLNFSGGVVVWVRVPVLVNGSRLFLYYGNSSAFSESDGVSVFDFFDDFEGGNLSNWVVGRNPVIVDDGSGNHVVYEDSDDSLSVSAFWENLSFDYDYRMRVVGGHGPRLWSSVRYDNVSGGSYVFLCTIGETNYLTARWRLSKYTPPSSGVIDLSLGSDFYVADVWYNVSQSVVSGGEYKVSYGNNILSSSDTTSLGAGGVSISTWDSNAMWLDDVTVAGSIETSTTTTTTSTLPLAVSISGDGNMSTGGNVSYSVSLTNPNRIPRPYNLSVLGLDSGWYSLSKSSGVLNAHEAYNLSLNVYVPLECNASGTYVSMFQHLKTLVRRF